MSDKDAFWFTHDSNARNDVRILSVRMSHGWEGYGAFFAIIETLRESPAYVIPCEKIEAVLFDLRISTEIFNKLLSEKLIEKNENSFFSASLLRRMEQWDATKQARRAAGRLGGKQKSSNAKAMLKQSSSKALAKPKQNVPRTEHEITGENRKEEKKHTPSGEGLRLAGLLREAVLKWKADAKTPDSLTAWATDIDRMMNLDKRTPESIEAVLKWLPTCDFWAKNVRSGDKLRIQFDVLEKGMNERPPGQAEAAKAEYVPGYISRPHPSLLKKENHQ